jgi:hypothetical protein
MRVDTSRRWLAHGLVIACLTAPAASAVGLQILLDGHYAEWPLSPSVVDPAGDGGASGVDFRNLTVAEDANWVFVRFDVTTEIPLQDTSNLVLYLDTDLNPSTGFAVSGLGAELRWRFGFATGTYFGTPPRTVQWEHIKLRIAPSTNSNEFEIALGRLVAPDGATPLFPAGGFRFLLRDESASGDQIPNAGDLAEYTFTNDAPPDDFPNDLAKDEETHVRVLTWNVLFDSPWDPGQDERYDRMMDAMAPDVINFQEIYSHTGGQTLLKVLAWLGPPWSGYKAEPDCVTLSRFSPLQAWTNQLSGNLAVLLDTNERLGRPLLLVNTHLPCCDQETERQAEADEIMQFVRDALTPGGGVDVPEDTAILLTGDMNLVGHSQQFRTLLTGDIFDEVIYGPDFAPDWDGSELLDLASAQTEVRMPYTWRGTGSQVPARLDMMLHTDSVLGVGNHFTLYTPEMSPAELAAHGLLAGDSPAASDHLPHVVDFYDRGALWVGAQGIGGHELTIVVAPNPLRSGAVLRARVPSFRTLTAFVFDAQGREVRRVPVTGVTHESLAEVLWDGVTDAGTRAGDGVYFVRFEGVDENGRVFRRVGQLGVLR